MTEMNYEWFREQARQRLPRGIFEYIDRGCEDELGLRSNRMALDSIKFLPRVLNDVSSRSQVTTIFGKEQKSPLIVAPTAAAGLVWYKGEVEVAKAAAAAGIPFCAATEAISSVEEIAEHAKGNVWFQLYVWKDRALTFELMDRAKGAGVETLVVTTDTASLPKREYNVRNGYDIPMRYTFASVMNILCHPRWLIGTLARYWLTEGMPSNANYPVRFRSSITQRREAPPVAIDAALNWEDIREIRRRWNGNLVIKGVLHPDTAVRALGSGADGIVVSNHGARMLDGAAAPADVLVKIVDLVGDKMTVLADSGVRRGADAVKLLSLGAKGVLAGRAFVLGAAANGRSGALDMMEVLKDEIDRTMAYLGCCSISDIGPDVLLKDLSSASDGAKSRLDQDGSKISVISN